MELITRNLLARTSARRWHGQYPDEKAKRLLLEALGERPSPDDVDRIIGNDSWTAVPECNECGRSRLPSVVQLGDEPDYDSQTAWVCLDCLRKAVALAETVECAIGHQDGREGITAAFSSHERKDMTMTDGANEGSAAMRGSVANEPAAWAVVWENDERFDRHTVSFTEEAAKAHAASCPSMKSKVVPLYLKLDEARDE